MWHNQGVARDGAGQSRQGNSRKRLPRPLAPASLDELALHYVSRFSTTRAKLTDYLRRKVRERGWEGEQAPDFERLVGRIAELGYVNDEAFALAKANSLSARGYGQGRVRQALQLAGVWDEDGAAARELAAQQAAEAALRFARRKRLGPFAVSPPDPREREKALAAMVRAGHGFALAKAVLDAAPGQELTAEELLESVS